MEFKPTLTLIFINTYKINFRF